MENIKFNDFMFKTLNHAISSVSEGEDLIPFVLTEKNMHRFIDKTLEGSIEHAEKYITTLKNEPMAALVYDGLITIQGIKCEAVFVKAYAKNEEKGILMAQRYRPKKFLKKFATIGNPAIVQYLPNIL